MGRQRKRHAEWFEKAVLADLPTLLGDMLDRPVKLSPSKEADLRATAPGLTFLIETKVISGAAALREPALRLKREARKGQVPLIVVPHMGETGRALLSELGVGWLDLSGNANIRAPGLRVQIEGKPNRFGRDASPNLFSPKASRIVRCLLVQHQRWFSQVELSTEAALDEGYTSRLVRELDRRSFIERNDMLQIRVREPASLLEEWRASARFEKHRISRGQAVFESGVERARTLAGLLSSCGIQYALTGLSAAWFLAPHAQFRLATIFVSRVPEDSELVDVTWRPDARVPDTWFVTPQDSGVFYGAQEFDGVCCVHPVQAYVDLAGQPERAKEAAEELKEVCLKW